ncbi:phosphatidylglycerol lysyltransferase domain-containing protein [Arthrobacter sp. NPDC090010]|uniref:phosphatidylglycerol lysyltransferase domain-containing protein n=1 Tax=Arthrobacter sp. NPDC090010 TaxID=3363942 RepID=UPI0037F3EA5E
MTEDNGSAGKPQEQPSDTPAVPDLGVPPRTPGRLRNTKDVLDGFFRRIPFSFLMAAVFLSASVFSGSLVGRDSVQLSREWGLGVDSTFLAGHWWTPFTALVLPQDTLSTFVSIGGALVLLGLAERTFGTRKAAIAFVATGVIGGILGVLLQWIGTLTWEWWSTGASTALTVDPMTGLMGALAAATSSMGLLWRRRIRVILLTYVLIFVLYSGDPEDLYRLIAVLVGLPLGMLLSSRLHSLRVPHSSHRETRTLVAAVVLVTAFGPLVAFLGSTDLTPFAFGSYLFMNDSIDPHAVLSACKGDFPMTRLCVRQLARIGSQGPGMMAMSFLPLILLGVAAWGLYRGRRFGWWLAVSVNAAILLYAPSSFGVVRVIAQGGSHLHRPFNGAELTVWVVTAALVPLASLVMLFITRKHFGIRAPKRAYRRFWLIVLIAFVVTAAAYYLTALADMSSILPKTDPLRLLLDTPRRFLPPHFVGGPTHIVLPRHSPISWAYQWSGALFWAVVLGTMIWLLTRSPRMDTARDVERFRTLLQRHGGGSLGHMTTWEGNTPWFRRDGDAALAYRVVNDNAIVLGDPVCARGEAKATVGEFLDFCDEHNWTPVFYSFHPELLAVFEELGWRTMSVGEETVVHTPEFSMKGKHWQSVRTALNKAVREGHTTVWTSWAELSFAASTEIVAISEAWVAENKLPEMGFTLGGLDELKDPEVRLMLALDQDGRIEAVTSWMPIQENDETVGWTLDFMRRSPESFNGVMEFLIASSALYMQEHGYRFMSLSGAPLATKPLPPGTEAAAGKAGVDAFLAWLSRTLEPAYGFSSLFRFKAKFHPEYVTLSMAYPDVLALPGIGVSLARAYLPDVSTRETMALARMLGRNKD